MTIDSSGTSGINRIGEIASSIVVDIGAGTTDIARIYGTFPTDEDQVTIQEAGDWLDNELMELIRKKYTGAQVTKDMVRKWKEEVSYVGGDDREAVSYTHLTLPTKA